MTSFAVLKDIMQRVYSC